MPLLRSNHGKGGRRDQRERKFRALMRFFPLWSKGASSGRNAGAVWHWETATGPAEQVIPHGKIYSILKLIFHANFQVPHNI
jgi:hypothetical protein